MTDRLAQQISDYLSRQRDATARQIADALDISRKEVNSVLYRRSDLFERHEGDTPLWSLAGSSETTLAAASGGPAAPDKPRSKSDALKAILAVVGSDAALALGPGSTEPKALFLEVNRRLRLGLDEGASKVALARAIAARAGMDWPAAGDSENTPSGGGDTVTLVGLQTVLVAASLLASGKPEPATEPEATLAEYRRATGGVDAPARELLRDWDALDSATRRHADLQNRIADAVRAAGLTPVSPRADQVQFDIAWEAAGRFVVCEVKSTTEENAVQQVRLGLGQVLEYRRALSDEHPTVVAAVACEVSPPLVTRRALTGVGVRLLRSEVLEEDLVPLL